MVEVTTLWRRLAYGIAIFAAFALFGITGWLELIRSEPVKMTLRDVRISEFYIRHPGVRSARVELTASFILDGRVLNCSRAFLFDQMSTTEQSAIKLVNQLSSKRQYDGRAIRGGDKQECWLVTDWNFPAAVAAVGFLLGFFLVRPRHS
jgi:hypothetical protein